MLKIFFTASTFTFIYIIVISSDKYSHYAAIFLFGILSGMRSNLSFIYGEEIVSEKNNYLVCGIFFIVEGSILIVTSLYHMYISKNWLY